MLVHDECFFSMKQRVCDRHYIGGLPSQMKVMAWEHELCYVSDQQKHEYLLHGIKYGFKIVDDGAIPAYQCENYNSCFSH